MIITDCDNRLKIGGRLNIVISHSQEKLNVRGYQRQSFVLMKYKIILLYIYRKDAKNARRNY
jgi:hypothetical protein